MAHEHKGGRPGGGDEPPIRVKSGSIEFRALGQSHEWAKTNGKWHPKSKNGRPTKTYTVVIDVLGPPVQPCMNAKRIEITHLSGGATSVFAIGAIDDAGKARTEIDPANKSLTAKNEALTYSADGAIINVRVDTQDVWSLGKGQLCGILIY